MARVCSTFFKLLLTALLLCPELLPLLAFIAAQCSEYDKISIKYQSKYVINLY